MQVIDFKQTLEQKQDEIGRRVDAIERDLQKKHSADSGEQALERENEEVLVALRAEGIHEIKLIHSALNRVKEGTYGVCLDCGEDIEEPRLKAYPEAERCIACAE
ncbi:RNA polymerase-binding transcription factor DksA [BD1-7 clade bacterium]|uniref:RNA polymerase-binding transcription factor DksA n=1 Tax=BD1-7 clade bacterium TaxID=2029982 RepID=A0A5S9QPX8_9GAMM|nr:RNA polymerase-binding transcription factor DksA [BD1-7 clade bacterium]CAA0097245.1 RNA polymerase-binding transcription factor DksA [BD1-7 clade bacterium]CAA0109873.1 RNA polymerase-binding transcription factor DksA [BD1-7 clade bacterium]CAA0116501.1 RNA polymerase-binding transcription factor DksA [BD1-7 clade bacterium]CAA0120129.1 RNA polymerase-binding transcription factor DksA [BD1-7 clade bacterium]